MSISLFSQKVKTIPLWNSKIPNAISNQNYVESPIYEGEILTRTSQVVTPTLTVFSPKKGTKNGTAVVIFPGGGYQHLAMNKEGLKVGAWLSSLGVTAFVLKYRLPSDAIMTDKTIGPLQDAQEAMRYIRRHATDYKLDVNKIGVLGFSAGGHLAATLSTHYTDVVYESDAISAKPDFSILIYPVISMTDELTHNGSRLHLLGESPTKDMITYYSNELQVNEATPPTFLVHATNDKSVPVENSVHYYLALKEHEIDTEMHLFEKGGHGFGLSKDDIHLHWKRNCENWLKAHKLIE
ncbi:alpha/beta hydrolase [Formosa sp. 4Alg 33]|uniref:alpha/beta hydrolase n=1 Tax=Formosa sp. 4Alg 33 TaxID=3382189 RepID=UPI003D9C3291